MLRTLGIDQRTLISLLISQAFYFSIPAVALGLLMCYIFYIPVEFYVANFASVPLLAILPLSAVLLASILGIALPIFGMLIPIRRALSSTLRDALDIFHQVVYETSVSIQKLADIGLSMTEIAISISMIFIGILVYYVVPLSFIFNDLGIFFRILTIILLGMVFGQVLLGQVVHHPLEVFISRLIMRGSDMKLQHIVSRNLGAHLRRNRRAALMFSLCLAYIIFASAMFTLQANFLNAAISWIAGAQVVVSSPTFILGLPEIKLRSYLDTKINGRGIVSGYSFITPNLRNFFPMQ